MWLECSATGTLLHWTLRHKGQVQSVANCLLSLLNIVFTAYAAFTTAIVVAATSRTTHKYLKDT